MNELTLLLTLTLGAGLAMPLGALIAAWEHISPQWVEIEFRHAVIAFGGGALISAVALVLVPDGSEGMSIPWVVFFFLAGAGTFLGLDVWLASMQSSASQLLAMLSDFIPEAMALGAGFALDNSAGILLAGLIALQNLPEGFNAYRELRVSIHYSPAKIILAFVAMALLGPLSGLIGYYLLSPYPFIVSAMMLFAAGGILYLIFQDIAPQAKVEHDWIPPLGAVLGFLLGLVGQMLVGR